jgi:hypothetical protein
LRKFWLALRSGYAGQHVVGLGGGGRPLGIDGHVSRLGDLLERLTLVGRIALDGLDEIGDEVVPTLELDVDLGPRRVDPVAEPDEAVVDGDEKDDQQKDDDQQHDEDDDHLAIIGPDPAVTATTGRERSPEGHRSRRHLYRPMLRS